MSEVIVGVIGGSGLYEIEGIENVREVVLETPFGAPSDAYIVGELEGATCVFLPRHGRGAARVCACAQCHGRARRRR